MQRAPDDVGLAGVAATQRDLHPPLLGAAPHKGRHLLRPPQQLQWSERRIFASKGKSGAASGKLHTEECNSSAAPAAACRRVGVLASCVASLRQRLRLLPSLCIKGENLRTPQQLQWGGRACDWFLFQDAGTRQRLPFSAARAQKTAPPPCGLAAINGGSV